MQHARDQRELTLPWILVSVISLSMMISIIYACWTLYRSKIDGSESYIIGFQLLFSILPAFTMLTGFIAAYLFAKERRRVVIDESTLPHGMKAAQRALPAEAVMNPIASCVCEIIPDEAERKSGEDRSATLEIRQLADAGQQGGDGRVIILSRNGSARYVLHEAALLRALVKDVEDPDPSLSRYLENAANKARATGFVTVGRDDTLDHVAAAMRGRQYCRDAIVTEDGLRGKPALGCISDIALAWYLLLAASGAQTRAGTEPNRPLGPTSLSTSA